MINICLWWQLAAYIAKNDSGPFGCVVTSKQWCVLEKVFPKFKVAKLFMESYS